MTVDAHRVVPLILCGGTGTRLWPMSRASRPKQFLPLTGSESPFQMTLRRLAATERYAAPIVISNERYRFTVVEQAEECGVELQAVLLEPVARNTAAAIAAGAQFVAATDPDDLLHVVPSDHEIAVDDAYRKALDIAIAAAGEGWLTTFGVAPTEPATGFGYIEAGEPLPSGAFRIARFVEKPAKGEAEKLIAAGNAYWNSGMFVFRAGTFLSECEKRAPEVFSAARAAVEGAEADLGFIRLAAEPFASAPGISVDYAIFEKTELAAIVPSPIEWSDLGSWDAVWKASPKNEAGNATRGPTNLSDTTGSLVVTQGPHVAVSGLKDVAVIASEDAVYVGRLSAAQSVGELVKALRADPSTQALTETHPTDYRPWGGYTSVLSGERFQVKRLFVKPGKRLSLQKHHHRAEHWVVVRGTAEVRIGDEVRTLGENESIYVPRGELHRLGNPGKMLLELIEVQTGSYLGEDDIIRVEDEFGRS